MDSTQRFSSRVENYVRYRPSYPPAVLDTLKTECGLTASHVIADIGSGTGLLSELFLPNGNPVLGVEPNREMREAAERILQGYPNFTSIDGTAEATTLPTGSIDFVTAGQAFHWFDHDRARDEFARILRPGGWVVLVWNYRRSEATPFTREYEQLIQRYSIDYSEVTHHRPEFDESNVNAFFGSAGCQVAVHPNPKSLDYTELQGRLLSSSYTPEAGHPNHEPMLAALRTLFETYQVGGQVSFDYDTKVYFGRLSP
ncbi:MAG: SAM-dependent methyltransferase [Chloroflexi bacterium]|nr:MAG: SAM-dependent methyltransferase [Chloroflexota bacterium]